MRKPKSLHVSHWHKEIRQFMFFTRPPWYANLDASSEQSKEMWHQSAYKQGCQNLNSIIWFYITLLSKLRCLILRFYIGRIYNFIILMYTILWLWSYLELSIPIQDCDFNNLAYVCFFREGFFLPGLYIQPYIYGHSLAYVCVWERFHW